MHYDSITADETWGAGVHVVAGDIRVHATLTIAPCAVVRLRSELGIQVDSDGTLIAEGTASQPIRFDRDAPDQPWGQLLVYLGQARLAYLTLEGGGQTSNDPNSAALWIRDDGTAHDQRTLVRVAHVTIHNAIKFGLRVEDNALFTADSTDLVITSSGQFPVLAAPSSVASLPPGQYTGNAIDEILVPEGAFESDATLSDRGVPYHIGMPGNRNTSLRVSRMTGPVPLLTIGPGVVLRFEPAANMEVEHFTSDSPASGALRVEGTADRPVVFTSAAATPAAGDWGGLWFSSVLDPRDSIDHARVEYAGGETGTENFSCDNPAAPANLANSNRAAIMVRGRPPGAFITNTTLVDSAADGIERGWAGDPIDFAAGNEFVRIAWCEQSYPRPSMGSCPNPVPCTRSM
jgi:hypothetical protein